MNNQRRAMSRALKYVTKYAPPAWRIQQCNRNASRSRGRVDWIGFDNCVRNARLVYQTPRLPRSPRSERKKQRQQHPLR
jgi:hypothetical protein